MKEKIKNNMTTIIIAFVIVTFLGIAYAWYVSYRETSTSTLIAGDIYFNLIDGEETINLVGVVPETTEEARSSVRHNTSDGTNNTLTFTIEGDNPTARDLYYEIVLNYGDELANYIRFKDSELVFDLIELDENDEEITPYLIDAKSYSTINYQRIYANKVDHDTEGFSKKYKIRMWLSYDVLISDTNPNADYPETGDNAYNKHYASVKIGALGNFTTKGIPTLLYQEIEDKALDTNITYVSKYNDVIASNPTFVSQDTVDVNNNKQEVYYYTGEDALEHGNVLFAGFCWQIVRTTDDGGVKLIYNGPAYEDTCVEGRMPSAQFAGTANQNADGSLNFKDQEFLYADSFSYNEDTRFFVLNNYYDATWSDNDSNSDGEADYKNLIGKYTCRGSYTCSTLYYVGHKEENGEPSYVTYTLNNSTNTGLVSQIGTSPFNAFYDSPNLVGYMYNGGVAATGHTTTQEAMAEITFGNYVEYNNGVYTLKTTGTGIANARHYTCNTEDDANATETTCETVRYYYRIYDNNGTYRYYFIRLTGGKTIESEMKEMFNYKEITAESDVNINRYSSAIKGLLDNWYLQNLSRYSNYLDKKVVYCNNRSTSSYAGWIKDGNLNSYIAYGGATSNANLNCTRVVDRFSVNNDNAKLTYPIGLLTEPERYLMGSWYAETGQYWWLASPYAFYNGDANERDVTTAGGAYTNTVYSGYAARPVITLHPSSYFIDGDGSLATPYVINTVN